MKGTLNGSTVAIKQTFAAEDEAIDLREILDEFSREVTSHDLCGKDVGNEPVSRDMTNSLLAL